MTGPEGKVAVIEETGATEAEIEEAGQASRIEGVSEDKRAGEKPRASEEIVIEEISIDGMCGVY